MEFDGQQLRLDAVDKSTLVLWDDCSGTALAWYLRSRRSWRATVQLAESEDDLTVAAGPIKRQLLSSAGIAVATLESSDHALLDRPQSHATSRLAPLNESLTVAITLTVTVLLLDKLDWAPPQWGPIDDIKTAGPPPALGLGFRRRERRRQHRRRTADLVPPRPSSDASAARRAVHPLREYGHAPARATGRDRHADRAEARGEAAWAR